MADNINTPYLGQSETADNLNTGYLGTGSASTEAEENPRTFSSEVSFTDVVSMDGVVTLGAALNSASAISAGGITSTQFTATDTDFASISTDANFNDMTVGEVRVVLAASGVSLGYSSGDSLYIVNSALSAAQPTS